MSKNSLFDDFFDEVETTTTGETPKETTQSEGFVEVDDVPFPISDETTSDTAIAEPPAETPEEKPQAQPEAAIEPEAVSEMPSKSEDTQNEADDDSFAKALRSATQSSEERLIEELAVKPPIFSYSGAKVDITENSWSFEDLRKHYETDYPELSEAKKVSWNVSYGGNYKTITNPNTEKIFETKAELEKTKKFVENLKKAKTEKDKKPECLVTPRVTAQSKGEGAFPPHKGVYRNLEEALQNPKPIMIIPSQDGKVYEIRNNEIGTFITPAASPPELSQIVSGFMPGLPRIPLSTLFVIMSFFKDFAMKKLEVMVQVLYDTDQEKYVVSVPKQTVSQAHISIDLHDCDLNNCIHVMDVHSHHQMEAKFSQTDDNDERATRLYAVVGRMDKFFPDITLRISNGGKYLEIPSAVMFESLYDLTSFPTEWRENVEIADKKRLRLKEGFFNEAV